MKSSDRFFHISELFDMTAKDWAELLNELEKLPLAERHEAFCGKDYEPYLGYE